MSQEIYKRELGLGEVLKESFKHFIENLELFFILTLILYIPLNLFFRFFIIEKLTTDLFGSSTLFLPLLFIILSIITSVVSVMTIAYTVKKKIDGVDISFNDALNNTFVKLLDGIKTNVIAFIFLLGLFCLLIIPGIIYSIYWAFMTIVVVLKGEYGKKALDYSKKVVTGRWWEVFAYLIVLSLPVLILSSIITLISEKFLHGNAALLTITDSVSSFIGMFLVVVMTVLFLNLDAVRKK